MDTDDLQEIMEQVSLGKRGKPFTKTEQQRISDWIALYESIDCVPELIGHLEKINNWYFEANGKYPESANVYHKSIVNRFMEYAKKCAAA